ncbi:response regulator transcription factor [Allokutzneria sp. A3M-2-11 16]|uniref:response regulator n=1 Tax=Allokutzneria sp. A3M-2-11 16 TaxID=2962043 RepID=UPI0020B8ECF9|nr:response regulator transcription factor [Allokutzneria sp. A3M-2-11 16]MCP3803760.1 response regulator transcription factor [Allokutzneria sp. A3M-2-11 16]
MIRVIVADDEQLVRAGIKLVLSSAPDIEVVAEAADGRAAVTAVVAHVVDVVLLDIRMPGLDGLDALAEIRRLSPRTRVVMLTTFGESGNIERALDAGAVGFLLKDRAAEELISAVRAIAAGEAFLSPSVTKWVIGRSGGASAGSRASEAQRRVAALSDREREVLELLAQGLSNADIAGRLFTSEATVKSYMTKVLGKLECANRVQAAILAHEAGLG